MKHPVFTNATLVLTYQASPSSGGTVHLIDGEYWQCSFDFCLDTSRKIGNKDDFKTWKRQKGL